MNASLSRRRARRSRRGIVLLDVVVALAVLSLFALVLMPRPRAGISDIDLQAEAARVAAEFRQGRAAAIRNRTHSDIAVDPSRRRVQMTGADAVQVREGVRMDWTTSNLCPVVGGARALRFLSDGRSCGAVLTMSAGPRAVQLRVDWLTGRVEMSRS